MSHFAFPSGWQVFLGLGVTLEGGVHVNYERTKGFTVSGMIVATGNAGIGVGIDLVFAKAEVEAGIFASWNWKYDGTGKHEHSYGYYVRGSWDVGIWNGWHWRREGIYRGGTGGWVPGIV